MGWCGMDWIDVAPVREHWRALLIFTVAQSFLYTFASDIFSLLGLENREYGRRDP
jgi:hypothetical protein